MAKNADDIRTDAIALLVEKLREIGAEADEQHKEHTGRLAFAMSLSVESYSDHREAAALNYALAYRCEQLAEAITGALLFDELDAQDEAAEQAVKDAEDEDERVVQQDSVWSDPAVRRAVHETITEDGAR